MVEYKPSLLDRTFTALSHEVRRAMLAELRRKEMRVTELAQPYAISLNMASKHIRLLEEARLVKRRVEGREHWISANPEPLQEAMSWIEAQAKFWSPRLQALAKIVEKTK
jgi:DNA-binding transcriptional ArsR family regulator